MKKFILLLAFFFSITTFAQKTVYIFNFSSYNVQVGEIQSKSSATSTYPRFRTNYSGGIINVPSGTTYTLENPNATYFPFFSPTSVPYINAWQRQFTAGATWANFLSTNLNNALATPQVFHFIKFQVGPNGSLGGGNLFDNSTVPLSGNVWEATYEPNGMLPLGGASIVIYDN